MNIVAFETSSNNADKNANSIHNQYKMNLGTNDERKSAIKQQAVDKARY